MQLREEDEACHIPMNDGRRFSMQKRAGSCHVHGNLKHLALMLQISERRPMLFGDQQILGRAFSDVPKHKTQALGIDAGAKELHNKRVADACKHGGFFHKLFAVEAVVFVQDFHHHSTFAPLGFVCFTKRTRANLSRKQR